ncbi:MAG TPA: alpha-galactosidase, partial [Puia sp.]
DIIHLRRADGRDWDGWMHVNAVGAVKGLVLLFNPLKQPITRKIRLPLYYTGLTGQASIGLREGTPQLYKLNGLAEAEVTVTLPAEGYTWLVVK